MKYGPCSKCGNEKQIGMGIHRICYKCRYRKRYQDPIYREKVRMKSKERREKLRAEGKLESVDKRNVESYRLRRNLNKIFNG